MIKKSVNIDINYPILAELGRAGEEKEREREGGRKTRFGFKFFARRFPAVCFRLKEVLSKKGGSVVPLSFNGIPFTPANSVSRRMERVQTKIDSKTNWVPSH